MDHIDNLIASGLAALRLTGLVSPEAPRRMDDYCRLLLRRNEVMNLTAITQPSDVAALHMLDSAALLTVPGVAWAGATLLDVGSGAGFPGLALKLLLPDLRVTLLDSQEKRVAWLREASAALGAEDVAAVQGRGEELGREAAWREQFDLVTARAVAGLPVLCELCLPFVRPGGKFLAMKGPEPETGDADAAIAALGGRLEQVYRYALPGTDTRHSVAVVEKVSPCPARYPRRWAKIRREPL